MPILCFQVSIPHILTDNCVAFQLVLEVRGQKSQVSELYGLPNSYSKNAYALNSAQVVLEGWDIPEAAYVASLCLLKETTLSK